MSPRSPHPVWIALAALALSPALASADDWSVTTADFHTQGVQLRGLTPAGVQVSAADGSAARTVPLDTFVSAQRTSTEAPAVPKFTLLLAGGDRLVGEPGAVAGETLTWVSSSLGPVPVPFAKLLAMGRGADVSLPDEPPKQDVVTLNNGDTVAGIFTGSGDGNLTIQTDAGPTPVALAGLRRVAFAATGAPVKAARGFRVRLSDGSAITAADVSLDGDAVKLTLPGKTPLVVPLALHQVLSVEQVNGPVGWLSSMTPVTSVQVPYLGGAPAWPARFDTSVDGLPLMFGNQAFDHGIGVHALSRLTFSVDPQWTAFRTQYAIDSHRDDPRTLADVTVRIKLDDRVVHEQQHVRAGALSPVVQVDLGGAKTITLECDYGPAGDTQAHLNWLQPALLRGAR